MATVETQQTAKIYQFPKKNVRESRDGAAIPRLIIYESGAGSWYHEDAIREAEETRKQ
jgi:hypothetical protein